MMIYVYAVFFGESVSDQYPLPHLDRGLDLDIGVRGGIVARVSSLGVCI